MIICKKCGKPMKFVCRNVLGSDVYQCECGNEFIDWGNIFPDFKRENYVG